MLRLYMNQQLHEDSSFRGRVMVSLSWIFVRAVEHESRGVQ